MFFQAAAAGYILIKLRQRAEASWRAETCWRPQTNTFSNVFQMCFRMCFQMCFQMSFQMFFKGFSDVFQMFFKCIFIEASAFSICFHKLSVDFHKIIQFSASSLRIG